jgi:hypothetical protein
VFRKDIGQTISFDELEAMSGKKRKAQIDAIRDSCRDYINMSGMSLFLPSNDDSYSRKKASLKDLKLALRTKRFSLLTFCHH